jgi:hypothetical protein
MLWIGFVVWRVPHWLHPAWAHALLLFAALVVVPLLIEIVRGSLDDAEMAAHPWSARFLNWAATQPFVAALLLAISCGLPAGPTATLLAIPWAAILLLLALAGLTGSWGNGRFSPVAICRGAGLVYASVGAAWLLADRAGLQPLGFSRDIVLLTAVHFHYAGLLLPVLASRALAQFQPSLVMSFLGSAIVLGVPAVAVGITTSQLHGGAGYEAVAALLMAFGGGGLAVLQVILATQSRWPAAARGLWFFSSGALLAGMILASLYGLRSVTWVLPWLDLPWMRALHGSVNALGFGAGATLAWFFVQRRATAGR